jgi:hypothetical protein
MAGTEIRVLAANRVGTTATAYPITGTSLSDANWFSNTGNEMMLLSNAGSGGTVYAHIIQRIDGELPAPKSCNVEGDAEIYIFGPFPPEQYGDPVQVWGTDGDTGATIVRVG